MCDQFRQNPSVNPFTNRPIKRNGRVYAQLQNRCADIDKCDDFLAAPSRNPFTGRTIAKGKSVYKSLASMCGTPDEVEHMTVDYDYRRTESRTDHQAESSWEPIIGIDEDMPTAATSDALDKHRLQAGALQPDRGAAAAWIPPKPPAKPWSPPHAPPSMADAAAAAAAAAVAPVDARYRLDSKDDNPYVAALYRSYSPKMFPPAYTHFSLDDRRLRAEGINVLLGSIGLDKWQYCVSVDSVLRKAFGWKLVGSGSFGNVFVMTFGDARFAIKEAIVEAPDRAKINAEFNNRKIAKWNQWQPTGRPKELKYQLLVNQILLDSQAPNFVFTAGAGTCRGCKLNLHGRMSEGLCYTVAMEAADGSGHEMVDEGLVSTVEGVESAMAQMLLALTVLQNRYGFVHNDIKLDNTLYVKVKPGGYFQYNMFGRTFYVPNAGFIAMIADFGVAAINKPTYSDRVMYGNRNAMYLFDRGSPGWGEDAGKEIKVTPFSTEYYPWFSKNVKKVQQLEPNRYIRYWKNDRGADIGTFTVNRFGAADTGPSVPVDLNDCRKFPCWEFVGDVLDVVRSFVGGPRSVQQGNHSGVPRKSYIDAAWRLKAIAAVDGDPVKNNKLYTTDGKAHRIMFPDVLLAYLMPNLRTKPAGQAVGVYAFP